MADNILRIPIQINGGGTPVPNNLKERELYVLDDGTLYVGKRNSNGTISPTIVIGKVISDADISGAKLTKNLFLDDALICKPGELPKSPKNGQVMFIDEGTYTG